jgi:hypothetical protein
MKIKQNNLKMKNQPLSREISIVKAIPVSGKLYQGILSKAHVSE